MSENPPVQATESASGPPSGGPYGLELLYGILFRPKSTFGRAAFDDAMGLAMATMLLVAGVLAFNLGGATPGKLLLAFVTAFGWLMLLWLVLTSALFLVTRFMAIAQQQTGSGGFPALLAATGLAFLPWIVLGPLVVAGGWGDTGQVVAALGTLMLLVWWLRLLLAAVRGVLGLSGAQGVVALVATELVLAALPMTYAVLWVMTLMVGIG